MRTAEHVSIAGVLIIAATSGLVVGGRLRIPDPQYTPAREPLRNLVRIAAFGYGRYGKQADEEVDPLVYWTPTHAGSAMVDATARDRYVRSSAEGW